MIHHNGPFHEAQTLQCFHLTCDTTTRWFLTHFDKNMLFKFGSSSLETGDVSWFFSSKKKLRNHHPAISYGCFRKSWYPQIINFNRVFHYVHHPFWGTIIFGNTLICLFISSSFMYKFTRLPRLRLLGQQPLAPAHASGISSPVGGKTQGAKTRLGPQNPGWYVHTKNKI